MKVSLLTVGHKQPAWVNSACDEYLKRLPREWQARLIEIKPEKRDGGRTAAQVQAIEAERISQAVAAQTAIVALDERGKPFTSHDLANWLAKTEQEGVDLAFVIGGADGLDPAIKQRAKLMLALSPMTLPHGMARVMLAEQLYRAWSINAGHPYHRD